MRTFEVIGRFILDIIFSVAGFFIIGVAAWLLGLFVKWLEPGATPQIILDGLKYLEYFIFALDAMGFLFLVLMSFAKFVREVWKLYKW